jgi:hypothetical protein
MRRIAIGVTILCGVVFATGLALPAAKAPATAVDTPALLLTDQPTDGTDRCVVLMHALSTARLAPGALLGCSVPQPTWLAGRVTVTRRVRPPPREPADRD